jgi:peptidyl-prolyl cis-trans isomerase C
MDVKQREVPMSARRVLLFGLIAIVGAVVVSCSGHKKEPSIKVKTGLAARVDDLKISEEEMLRLYEELPDNQKKEFRGREGQAKFVDRLIEQNLLYLAALDDNLDKTDKMKDQIRWATMNLLVAEYFNTKVADKIKISPEEVEAYYKANQKEFVQPPVMRAQYLFTTDSLKAVGWEKRLARGELFTKIATAESEDKSTAPAGGDVGYFNPGGYIKGVGQSEVFGKAVENLPVGKASGIIKFEKGFAIVKVTEKNPEKVQTLDEARSKIEERLRAQKTQDAYQEAVERLKKKYGAENYVRERLDKTTRTAEELWEMAQIESDPKSRIQYYRDIVNMYPDHKSAPEALFMIGFTYAEDVKDFVQARRTFDELKRKYPHSSMLESAQWMIDNMETSHPKVESLEGVQKQVEEEKAHKAGGTK